MTALWIALAFVAGMYFWHKAGYWMLRKAFSDEAWTKRTLSGLSDDSLKKLVVNSSAEMERRKKVLS